MKIRSVKISNILSFPLKTNFDTATPDIIFDDKLNIIVGANGSGKSNFVEIIFTLFQTYFMEPYNYDYAYDNDRLNHPKYITKRGDSGLNLRLDKNNKSTSDKSELYVNFSFNEADKKNLQFLKDNLEKLNSVVTKYAPNLITLADIPISEINIDQINEVSFKFIVENSNKNAKVIFNLVPETNNKIQKVIDFYLRNFDLIRRTIETGIDRESFDWENLVISFEFLGSHRLISSFPTNIGFSAGLDNNISNLIVQKKNQNIRNNTDISYVFGIMNAKIGNQIREDSRGSLTITQSIDRQFIDNNSLLFTVNTLLKEYLGISVRHKGIPSKNIDTLNIELYNCGNNDNVNFEQLSSGQKSICTLIFLVTTSELQNGLLMIDEPEIHLHPRFQKKYFELLKEFSEKYNLQSILITHSPVFIDEKTIKNTYRFYADENGQSNIIKPEDISSSEEDLIRFLSYTNSSKIFFTNKVIIVEGDTDSYFYTYLLNNHIKTNQEIEFLAIGGKSAYKKWFDFLDKFKIKHYFLADFDFLDRTDNNALGIQETREKIASQGLNSENIEKAKITLTQTRVQTKESYNLALDSLLTKSLTDITENDLIALKKGSFLERQKKIKYYEIIEELEKNQDFKTKVETTIKELNAKNIFVLRWGALEDYLSVDKKRLQNIVIYCANDKFNSMPEKFKNNLVSIFNDLFNK